MKKTFLFVLIVLLNITLIACNNKTYKNDSETANDISFKATIKDYNADKYPLLPNFNGDEVKIYNINTQNAVGKKFILSLHTYDDNTWDNAPILIDEIKNDNYNFGINLKDIPITEESEIKLQLIYLYLDNDFNYHSQAVFAPEFDFDTKYPRIENFLTNSQEMKLNEEYIVHSIFSNEDEQLNIPTSQVFNEDYTNKENFNYNKAHIITVKISS